VAAAGKLLKESSAAAVKLEGADPEIVAVVDRLVRMGIPVMGHLGLTPQAVHRLGYRRQARDLVSQDRLIKQAITLEKTGCFALVLEHVPAELAGRARHELSIPVIGIGAGDNCDGQVRVTADLLGMTSQQPPFSQPLLNGRQLFIDALTGWIQQHHTGSPTTTPPPAEPDC
jgi:3-methyl-2-oxobutanoate hydroxymethyltransferase